jgi:hypothetical protein
MTVWHFRERGGIVESLTWKTDVFQAKSGEQRIALRAAPRRTFNISHLFNDYQSTTARAMILADQGGDGFLVPDWPQLTTVGAVSAGSSVVITVDTDYINIGTVALLWQSPTLFEQITISVASTEVTATTVAGTYTNAILVPLWSAYCPSGLSVARTPGQINEASVEMNIYDNQDLAATTYAQYRSHDVMPTAAIVSSGQFVENTAWPVSTSDNLTSIPEHLRTRSILNQTYIMRWHEFTRQGLYELRQWIHSRRGRQKVFWFSSRGHDFEPAVDIAGTTITVFKTAAMQPASYDIDVRTAAGVSSYHQVTAIAGRDTSNLTITPTLTVTLANLSRISLLRCTRFNADRILLKHSPASGEVDAQIQIPCLEVPIP